MNISKFILSTCLLAALSACDNEKDIAIYEGDSGALQLEVSIANGYGRSNPIANDETNTQFNEGDCVQLICEDGYMAYEFSKGKWQPADNCYFRWGNEPLTYSAFYPTISGTSLNNFTVPSNQQTLTNLANADYMTGTVENAVDDGSHKLRMTLNRKMARVIMTLADVGDKNKVQGIKIGSYQGYLNGEINTSTGLITPYVTVAEGVKAGQNGCSYTAIVAPGPANPSATFVTFNYLGEDMTLPGIPQLTPGMSYEFVLKVEGASISITDPIVTPWESGTIAGGDATELVLDAYYVKSAPTGNGSGLDWDNAMGVDGLRSLLQTSSNSTVSNANAAKLDGKNIYLAGGTYEMAKDNSGVKIEYSGYSKPVEITINGGYDPASKGSDLTKRDASTHVTKLVRNTSSNADGTSKAMLCLGNQVNLTISGCVLDGQFKDTDKNTVCGLLVGAGSSGDAILHVNDCIIRNFNRANNGNDNGAGLKLSKGTVFLNRVEFTGNRGANRGAAILLSGNVNTVKLFMNNCLLHENYAPGAWGTTIHAGQGWVCMNNTTVLGTPGTSTNSITVNGDAHFLIVNSTIITASGNPNGAFRAGALSSTLVNSMFVKGTGTRTIYAGNITSGGYNLFQAADANWGATGTDTDFTNVELPAPALTDGVYKWTVGSDIDKFASRQNLLDAIKAFDANVGQEFINWVGTDGFTVDQRGASRNPAKLQPGAYDANL